jgi:hypothetical protein
VTERLVDVDDATLQAARMALGTASVEATIHEALRRVAATRAERVADALNTLARAEPSDREDAWH